MKELEQKLNKNGVSVKWDKDYDGKCYSYELNADEDDYKTQVLFLKQMVLPFGLILKEYKINKNSISIKWAFDFTKSNDSFWNVKELTTYRE